jgi:hypothetical protein
MPEKSQQTPQMLTVRQTAATGILSEHALRLLLKQGKIPALYINSKALLDYGTVCEYIRKLSEENLAKRRTAK